MSEISELSVCKFRTEKIAKWYSQYENTQEGYYNMMQEG